MRHAAKGPGDAKIHDSDTAQGGSQAFLWGWSAPVRFPTGASARVAPWDEEATPHGGRSLPR